MNKIKVYAPAGAMGKCEYDTALDTMLRKVAEAAGNPEDWNEKYGTLFENDIFRMHPYCWCDRDECKWCREVDPSPNFEYKPTGFKVWWYKYIGRETEASERYSKESIEHILDRCVKSVKKK